MKAKIRGLQKAISFFFVKSGPFMVAAMLRSHDQLKNNFNNINKSY